MKEFVSLHFCKLHVLQWSQVRSNGALRLEGKESSLLAESLESSCLEQQACLTGLFH